MGDTFQNDPQDQCHGGHEDKNDPQDLHPGGHFSKTTLETSFMGDTRTRMTLRTYNFIHALCSNFCMCYRVLQCQ